jgi:K(+)-stimulated pyrophosphate-energized sodium pump
MTDLVLAVAAVTGLVGPALAAFEARRLRPQSIDGASRLSPDDRPKLEAIASAIQDGVAAFWRRISLWTGLAVAVVAIPLIWRSSKMGIGFLIGALLSWAAVSMSLSFATIANKRTALAADSGGMALAFPVAFGSAAVFGFTQGGAVILVAVAVLLGFGEPAPLAGMALGMGLVSFVIRVAGGVFTKAADVGADLAGKLEQGLPENDPRNPAAIADNIGDNVGNLAGVGSDLLSTYLTALALAMMSGESLGVDAGSYPLIVSAVGMLASVVGWFFVRAAGDDLAFRRGTVTAVLVFLGGGAAIAFVIFAEPWGAVIAITAGVATSLGAGYLSRWFTSDQFTTTKEVARQATTGAPTALIAGLAEGLRSAAFSLVLVTTGALVAGWAGAVWFDHPGYGLALGALSSVAILGLTTSMHAVGPIADNAGGVAALAGLDQTARAVTESLRTLGSSSVSVTKGYGAAGAALATLAAIVGFAERADLLALEVTRLPTIAALVVGALIPLIVASLLLNAVARTAGRLIDEARRQFEANRDLDPTTHLPDYRTPIGIATNAALREVLIPGALVVALPVAIGLVDTDSLAGFVVGALVSGFLIGMFMINAGGAWESAKHLVEAGAFGGRGSAAHEAVVVADAVGDSFKDAAGPALIVAFKLAAVVALVVVLVT